MANITLKKSSVTGKVPLAADLAYGELALNYADGKLYYKKSNGTTIEAFTSGTGTLPLHIGDTPPASPAQKPLWWDSIGGVLYVYYTDADGSQWVPATPSASGSAETAGVTAVTTTALIPGQAVIQLNDGSGNIAAVSETIQSIGLSTPNPTAAMSNPVAAFDISGSKKFLVLYKNQATLRAMIGVGVIDPAQGYPYVPLATDLFPDSNNGLSIAYDVYTATFIIAHSTNNGLYVRLAKIVGNNVVFVGSEYTLTGAAVNSVKLLHGADNTTNGGLLLVDRAGSGLLAYRYVITGGTTFGVSGSPTNITATTNNTIAAEYDSTNQSTFIAYGTFNSTVFGNVLTYNSGTGVFTKGIDTSIATMGSSRSISVCLTGTPGLYVLAYTQGIQTGLVRRRVTVSGSSFTLGNTSSDHINTATFDLVYDSFNNRVYHTYTTGNTATAYLSVYDPTSQFLPQESVYQLNTTNAANANILTYDAYNYRFVVYSAGPDNFYSFIKAAPVTNLTSTNYLGISSDTYSANQTAEILTDGQLSVNHAQLTPGWVYYLNTDGQLTSSETNTKVGTAITPASVLLDRSVTGILSTDIIKWNTVETKQDLLISGTNIRTVNGNSLLGSTNLAVGDVTTSGTQTLTNKTISGGIYSGVVDVSGSARSSIVTVAALDINCSVGNFFTKTIAANSTFTFSNAPSARAYSFTLELTHTSGSVTWPAAVSWPGSTAPTLTTNKVHLFMFITDDAGTSWRGAALVNY